MKTGIFLVLLLLGVAFTFALPTEEDQVQNANAPESDEDLTKDVESVDDEDHDIEEDEEDDEDDEEDDEENDPKLLIFRRRCRRCQRKVIYRYRKRPYYGRYKLHCRRPCYCKRRCLYKKCYGGYTCKRWRCSRRYSRKCYW
ncbi:ATPase family AAA domain-containing protein 2-like [Xenia sp. Carnegie-2017]|uniref:ATPase family AAA domain-containing protein 2-like n=1 Tax=Xenia sp. Carnegie-2017 TaxID=2897299 RepID=UPI001F03AC60|nr:ATPase family AAA domain-containing protein 2-like [Xenia sp. Carnegie-2017]